MWSSARIGWVRSAVGLATLGLGLALSSACEGNARLARDEEGVSAVLHLEVGTSSAAGPAVSLPAGSSSVGGAVDQSSEQVDVLASFVPSGWMGDGEQGTTYVTWTTWREGCHGPPVCVRVTYEPGPLEWAGIYLQNRDQNWGEYPGLDLSGHSKLTFWARAETRGSVEFKAGGIRNESTPYRDSFEASLGFVNLDSSWRRFEIDLTGHDLSSVIGGFAWIARGISNPDGLTFYIDEIYYEN